ncbi:MAG: aromatic ring-hydroxylating dioxygenase subunit alpha [Cellvibrionaceae bacterium]|nr:aromatic ring-hydroxylating dioxygenase subunit alpha [Cellvibrionaceae bacterium]
MLIDVKNLDIDIVEKRGMPGAVFKDPEIFDRETKTVFRNGWASVASVQQLKEPGDIIPIKIAGFSLLIMKDARGEIGVFHNVCRHKGAPLIDKPCNKRVVVCPYHRWSFQTNGEFIGAPCFYRDQSKQMPSEEKAGKGLLAVRFAIWWDTIFVNISGEAEPFEEFIRPLNDLLSDYDSQNLNMISSTEYESSSNWKLAVDNFLDGYHVPFVHSQAVTLKAVLKQEDLFLSDDIVGLRLANGASDKPAKTDKPLPHFAGLPEEKTGMQQWFGIFPNTLFFVDPRWMQMILIRPEAADYSTETLSLYTVSKEAASDEYKEQRENLSVVLNEVNRQDIELLDKLQHSRTREAADQGTLVEAWDQVAIGFHKAWLKKI